MTRVLLALCLCAATARAGDKTEAPIPRYRLTPGQEISYRSWSVFKYGEGKSTGEHRNGNEWTAWVLRTNPDGSARLLIRDVGHFIQVRGGKESPDQPHTMIVYADMFPDGRIPTNDTIRYRAHPSRFLPQLPKDAAETRAGWEAATTDGDTARAKMVGENRFAVTVTSDMDKIYLSSMAATYTFDPARGLVSRVETESTQGYGFNGKGTGTVELVGVRTLPPAELAALAALAADADRYFADTAAYDEAFKAAEKLPPDQARAALTRAVEGLKSAAEAVTQPDLKRALANRMTDSDQSVKRALQAVERRAKVVGKPAFAADLTDLGGKPVKLSDLKGKVLVLDFWYRGCGWCVKSMPQINQLVGDFAAEPVAVLGMNTDDDKADAEFVIREMGLKYRTLRLKHELAEKFGVRGFPTLVLVDKKGVVRDLHVGYSATLRVDIGKAVRELLAEE